MKTSNARNSLEKQINIGNTSLCLFDIIPKHFSGCKVILEVCHDTVIAHDNVALGASLFLVIVPRNHTALKGGPKNLLKTLLVDRDLNSTIEPFVVGVLLFRNTRKVLLIRLEGLGRNKTFEDTRSRKVRIPKDSKECNDCKKTFYNNLSNRCNVPAKKQQYGIST
jgi:hypothetical protein